MAEKIDEEHVENPINYQPGNTAEEITSTAEAQIKNLNREIENMDVHHHSHSHGKKNWKSYIWEFLMLFLAVFCGFLAEYQLEHVIEHQREKEYIVSMIEDAKTDTANLKEAIALNTLRFKRLDTLASLCLNYDMTGNDDGNILRLFRYGRVHPAFVSPIERTIQQLKNAGGMRMIRKKVAVDSIILYDDMSKKLMNQQGFYELYQNKSIEAAAQIMNFQDLGIRKNQTSATSIMAADTTKKLINHDRQKIIEFGNMIDIYQGVVRFYTIRLQETNEHATHLIQTLQKEYHLENE